MDNVVSTEKIDAIRSIVEAYFERLRAERTKPVSYFKKGEYITAKTPVTVFHRDGKTVDIAIYQFGNKAMQSMPVELAAALSDGGWAIDAEKIKPLIGRGPRKTVGTVIGGVCNIILQPAESSGPTPAKRYTGARQIRKKAKADGPQEPRRYWERAGRFSRLIID
jgi:hypothetical protein